MPTKKTTILVIDDDVQLLKIVTHNLQAEGYQVLAIRDGAQALEAMERDTPDLVLLDVMLPGMDGFEVCQRVREFSAVPIIMITARGRGQDKVKGLDLGADDYSDQAVSCGRTPGEGASGAATRTIYAERACAITERRYDHRRVDDRLRQASGHESRT